MYLNGIKHNMVTKLNPLTLNICSDEQTHGRPTWNHNTPHYRVAGYKNIKLVTCITESGHSTLNQKKKVPYQSQKKVSKNYERAEGCPLILIRTYSLLDSFNRT